jgi:hypothetical protein
MKQLMCSNKDILGDNTSELLQTFWRFLSKFQIQISETNIMVPTFVDLVKGFQMELYVQLWSMQSASIQPRTKRPSLLVGPPGWPASSSFSMAAGKRASIHISMHLYGWERAFGRYNMATTTWNVHEAFFSARAWQRTAH